MPPFEDLIFFAIALAGAGAVAGVLAGLFGIGGGAILVPVFYQVFGLVGIDDAVRMHVAVGTSLAIIVPTSVRSMLSHRKRGAVDDALLRNWAIAVPLGAVLASGVAAYASSEALRGIFAAIAVVIGVRMVLNRKSWRLGNDLPRNPYTWLVGVAIGLLSGLMGVGGGVLNNTFMTSFNRPVHQAVATSAGVGVLIAIPGMIGYIIAGWGEAGLPPFSTGYVNWITAAMMIPGSMLMAPVGANLAHRLSRRQLEVLLGIFLFLVAARFFLSL
ncbi:sulfite exporter TauE/SafE family protein [Pararhizobium haloflavum]|uniref:sulfite exporter TauE/SafE family protein n=1 Tax=Pararhizobium haloflavum TaxID=2037914 RepID=UPI000C18CE15|nr:sulfite exporter TauE/SafE family protein [Pararhizobium haloflavum]